MQQKDKYYTDVSDNANTILEIETQISYRPHFGNNFFLRMRDGQPSITIGPHWPLSLCLIVAIIGGTYLLSSTIYIRSGTTYSFISALSGLFLEICFLRVFLKNPGVNFTFTNVSKEVENEYYCIPCKLVKQPGTVHCLSCDICVRGHDHHCPWVGKCIGEGNMMEFQLFLASFMVFFVCNLILVMI